MLRLKQNKYGIWQVTGTITVWRDGQPDTRSVRRSARTRNKTEAEGIRRQIENEAAERNITNKEPTETFQTAAKRYIEQGGERRFLNKIMDAFGHISLDRFDRTLAHDISRELYPNAKPDTIRRQCYTPLIAVLNNADHPHNIKPPKSKGGKRTHFFTPKQADSFIKAIAGSRYPNPWTPALVTFLFAQGSRVGETIGVQGTDVNLSSRYAILRDTKNNEERMVYLTNRTCAAIQHIPNLGMQGPLFLRYDGRPYEVDENRGVKINHTWNRALDDVGLDRKLTPHTARHSWATWYYGQTKDVTGLRDEGGWKSAEWQRYVKFYNAELGEQARKYGFIFDGHKPAAFLRENIG